jgi:hypothetical protein
VRNWKRFPNFLFFCRYESNFYYSHTFKLKTFQWAHRLLLYCKIFPDFDCRMPSYTLGVTFSCSIYSLRYAITTWNIHATFLWNIGLAIALNCSGWPGPFLNPLSAAGLPSFLQTSKTPFNTFVCILVFPLSPPCIFVVVSHFGILQSHKYFLEHSPFITPTKCTLMFAYKSYT